jgi:hypothetical protein
VGVASEASVRLMLAGMLHKQNDAGTDTDVTKLSGFWTPITAQSTAEAEAWLRAAVAGFGEQAVAKWAMFEHYHRKLALFWCGVYGSEMLTDDQRLLLQKLDCRAEVMALESIGPDDPNDTTDDAVLGGLMSRKDDLFRRPSVCPGGRLPADVFNRPRGELSTWWR